MKKVMLCILAFATLLTTALRAQDLSGNWQGTLKAGGKDIRLIVNIYKGDKDGWSGKLYSIDQTPQPLIPRRSKWTRPQLNSRSTQSAAVTKASWAPMQI